MTSKVLFWLPHTRAPSGEHAFTKPERVQVEGLYCMFQGWILCEHFWPLAQFVLFHGQVASTVWSSLQPSGWLPLWLSVPCGHWGLGCTHFSRFLLTLWYRTVEIWRPHLRPEALTRSSNAAQPPLCVPASPLLSAGYSAGLLCF